MKRVNLLIIFAILTAAAIVPVSRARDISAGTALENFTLSDINGKDRSFNDLKGKNGNAWRWLARRPTPDYAASGAAGSSAPRTAHWSAKRSNSGTKGAYPRQRPMARRICGRKASSAPRSQTP